MKSFRVLTAVTLSAVCAVATAQTTAASSPPTRADVKAEGRAAQKAGETPHGEVGNKPAEPRANPASGSSSQTRASVKADAAKAKSAGEISTGELTRTPKEAKAQRQPPSSTTTRADVKAEAKTSPPDVGEVSNAQKAKTTPKKKPSTAASAASQ